MNYNYDTTMLPNADILRVCLSCWRRLPSHFARKIQHQKFPTSTVNTCSSYCGKRWTSLLAQTQRGYCTSERKSDEFDVTQNPFFEKYKQKLQHLQNEDPDEFKSRMEEIERKKEDMKKRLATPPPEPANVPRPEVTGPKGAKTWPPKSLDEIFKVDLVKDLQPDAIKNIWQEHHLSKDCVFGVVPALDFEEMITKSKLNPIFIYPLPKGDGYEFYLAQFDHNNVYFTPLGMYQLLKENAPPCLSIAHFPELKDDKGIVLMSGEYDDKVIKKPEALNLVRQMTLYYGKDSGDRYKILRAFSSQPDQFDHMSVIAVYQEKKDFLENNPY